MAGARWKGTKVKLGSDDEEEDDEGDGQGQEEGEEGLTPEELRAAALRRALGGLEEGGIVILPPLRPAAKPRSTSAAAVSPARAPALGAVAADGGAPQRSPDSEAPRGAIKWKKLTTAVLSQVPGGMKRRKLVKQVLKAAGVPTDNVAASEQLLAVLQQSSKFMVDCKMVALKKTV